jgi:hypothetical protein
MYADLIDYPQFERLCLDIMSGYGFLGAYCLDAIEITI